MMDESIEFADRFIRGITNKQFISDDGYPLAPLYQFRFDVPEYRTDNCKEESINWHDEENALRNVMLNMKKGMDVPKFSYGAAITDKSVIETLSKNKRYKDSFSYERRKVEGNEYHGNLLFKATASKRDMLQLAECIAGQTYIVIKRDDYIQNNQLDLF